MLRDNGHERILEELRATAETVRKASSHHYDNTILKLELCKGPDWRGCGIGSGYSVLGTHAYTHFSRFDLSTYEQIYFIGHEPARYKETCLWTRDNIEQVISSATPRDVVDIVRSLERFTPYGIRQKL
jgi:hypothetical protein